MVWIASLVAASTSLLPSVPTFALPAKPAIVKTSPPVQPASASTSLVAPQPALEDDDFGAHNRGISNKTELKTHGGLKKRVKPVAATQVYESARQVYESARQVYESARQVYESARKKLAVERVALMRLQLAEAERDLDDVS